jgi:DNA-directed RNA polymerase specialized sigma24 family protein
VPVTRAVFVEVWRLAPASGPRRDDVLAWVTGIAARRATDRLRALDQHPPAVDATYDGHVGLELAAALGVRMCPDLGAAPGRG